MAVLKCKMCGGDIEALTGQTYGTCNHCGTTSTLPKAADEQIANLFNRANHFRRLNEFDKAISTYENVLNTDMTSSEAHWGLVLSKYGIEYVEDPVSHERIPTCHRVQNDSLLVDANYLAALDNASDEYSRSLYEEEAKRIADIQRGILAISSKEKPYDVFICCKETTDGGSRTKDSAIAQDIYHQLTNEGYNVFFSRITLEKELGQHYEPYIFAALNSAKVMVVVGTKTEYFNSVWVKNEWSRFLALSKKDRSKLLIPCYSDIDAYDLPEELSMLQSQDMSKIGFMQDIIRGIKKVLASSAADTQVKPPSEFFVSISHERLIKNSETYLKLGNYPSAKEVFDRLTKEYPEDHRGWWGLIICETESLSRIVSDMDSLYTLFRYVKQLAPQDAFPLLEDEFVEYNRILAAKDAIDDINTVKDLLTQKESALKTLYANQTQAIEKKNLCIETQAKQSTLYNAAITSAQESITKCETLLAQHKRTRTGGNVVLWVGLALSLLGFLGVTTGSSDTGLFTFVLTIGVISVIAAGLILTSASTQKSAEIKNLLSSAQIRFSDSKRDKKNNEIHHKNLIKELEQQLSEINNQIEHTEKRIKRCNMYLDYGKDKITEVFFSQRCAMFGVTLDFDDKTMKLRNRALKQRSADKTDG